MTLTPEQAKRLRQVARRCGYVRSVKRAPGRMDFNLIHNGFLRQQIREEFGTFHTSLGKSVFLYVTAAGKRALAELETPKVLTVTAIPRHRIQNDRLVLHYKTRERGWLSSSKFHALLRKGARIVYA
jgi:hypothetical protein